MQAERKKRNSWLRTKWNIFQEKNIAADKNILNTARMSSIIFPRKTIFAAEKFSFAITAKNKCEKVIFILQKKLMIRFKWQKQIFTGKDSFLSMKFTSTFYECFVREYMRLYECLMSVFSFREQRKRLFSMILKWSVCGSIRLVFILQCLLHWYII